jgi:hypothetical protein
MNNDYPPVIPRNQRVIPVPIEENAEERRQC